MTQTREQQFVYIVGITTAIGGMCVCLRELMRQAKGRKSPANRHNLTAMLDYFHAPNR